MERILEHFKAITAIPRCSFNASKMQDFIVDFAKKHDFHVTVDDAHNVLCVKGNPKVCLQAHYDMVCIGETACIELVCEGNILKAKNSTLGADNGMGMAFMFDMMTRHNNLECLFTADEEVGLIGASRFKEPLASSFLLNLDSEEEGEICIGCAGGVDVIATYPLQWKPRVADKAVYEVVAEGFLGGHSGIDIDKGIPSAIKVLARELSQKGCELIHFEGGDRRNAIAKSARAIVATSSPLTFENEHLHVKCLDASLFNSVLQESHVVLGSLQAFAQGVRSWDKTLGIPSVSINMGLVRIEDGVLRLDCAARAMDDENLAILADETQALFETLGFHVVQENWHGAWKPNAGVFADKVKAIMQDAYEHVCMYAVHAGLECGELIAHQPKKIEALSIGPTIRFPHSLREECDLDSVERMHGIVEKIINEVTYGTY